MPDLVVREAAMGLAVIAAVFVISALFDAPLGAEANPQQSANPAKAPWYFMGVQELLMHMHPFIAVYVVPLGAVALLCLLPRWGSESGVWFSSQKGRKMSVICSLVAFVITPVLVVLNDRTGPDERLPMWLASIALPLLVIVGLPTVLGLIVRTLFKPTRGELAIALFMFVFTSFCMLTVIGIWFRGAQMALVVPWGGGG